MLVLSRRNQEKIYIGDKIVLTICAISGDKVRIGIEAPKEIPIIRPEAIKRDVPPVRKAV